MAIYVTGDTHRRRDLAKLDPSAWPEGHRLTRDDLLVICGDYGAIWIGSSSSGLCDNDLDVLSWWERQPWTTLFVDGNHENHDAIDALPVTGRWGGRVQVVPGFPHVIHLMRGEVYDLPTGDGAIARCFVMGGAESTDRMWRVEGVDWWAREMPSDEEYAAAEKNLRSVGWSVDYVFTHEVPYNAVADALDWKWWIERRDPPFNSLTGFLQYVDEQLDGERLKKWYAGHYHRDMVTGDGRHCVLYQSVVRLGEAPNVAGE